MLSFSSCDKIIFFIVEIFQQRVYEEVIDAVGIDGEITYDALRKLELTERIIKETWRILPVVNVIVRETNADIKLGK